MQLSVSISRTGRRQGKRTTTRCSATFMMCTSSSRTLYEYRHVRLYDSRMNRPVEASAGRVTMIQKHGIEKKNPMIGSVTGSSQKRWYTPTATPAPSSVPRKRSNARKFCSKHQL